MKEVLCSIILLIILCCRPLEGRSTSACKLREKSKASLNMAKTSLSIVKELYPDCSSNKTTSNTTHCGTKQESFGYVDVAMNLINYALDNYPTCTEDIEDDNKTHKFDHPMDCSEILKNGQNVSGVYSIWLKNGTFDSRRLEVYCDMDTDGGGWTVIQRRGDFPQQENFFRVWADYKKGFGNISRDFWLGNDNIFSLTNQSSYSIRFDLEESQGRKAYAVYQSFKVGDEASKYLLSISNYSGNAGDAMKSHNNKKFSTKDNGNDDSEGRDYCTRNWKGGWWYGNCYEANLNGIYRKGVKSDYSLVTWLPWKSNDCLTSTEIKLRRI